jgi:hypothetical protein
MSRHLNTWFDETATGRNWPTTAVKGSQQINADRRRLRANQSRKFNSQSESALAEKPSDNAASLAFLRDLRVLRGLSDFSRLNPR